VAEVESEARTQREQLRQELLVFRGQVEEERRQRAVQEQRADQLQRALEDKEIELRGT
jgi:hypothetical protein